MRKTKKGILIVIFFVFINILGLFIIPLQKFNFYKYESNPEINITYSWNEASAKIIEEEVTSKIEGFLSLIKGVKEIKSKSTNQNGSITISFKENIDLDIKRFEVLCVLRRIIPFLPKGISYPLVTENSSHTNNENVLIYTLSSDLKLDTIKKFAEDVLIEKLKMINGISDINIFGGTNKAWEIKYDLKRTRILQISKDDIANSINNFFQNNYIGKGNVLSINNKKIDTSSISIYLKNDLSESIINSIPIIKIGERIIKLSDVASCTYKEQFPITYHRINGLNTITILISLNNEGNLFYLIRKIKSKIEDIDSSLPNSFSLVVQYDPTTYLLKELQQLMIIFLFSILIFILIYAFSRSYKYVLTLSITYTSILTLSSIIFYLFKIEIDLFTLSSIVGINGLVISLCILKIDSLIKKDKSFYMTYIGYILIIISILSIFCFIKNSQTQFLIDFLISISIILVVSLPTTYYLVPGLIYIFNFKYNHSSFKSEFNLHYLNFLFFLKKWKYLLLAAYILVFGIPFFLLPEKIEAQNSFTNTYNDVINNDQFKTKVRPLLEKIFGGTLNIFVNHINDENNETKPSRTAITINSKMPEGTTIHQLNDVLKRIEDFLILFDEIEYFETTINNYNNSNIKIYFKPKFESSSFPTYLKGQIEERILDIGGVTWGVVGVGQPFINQMNEPKSELVIIEGYNYEQLSQITEKLKIKLSTNPRITDVSISDEESWFSNPQTEYFLEINSQNLALKNITNSSLFLGISANYLKIPLSSSFNRNKLNDSYLLSNNYSIYNIWKLNNLPLEIENDNIKVKNLGIMKKSENVNSILKVNQQYKLIILYNFNGSYGLAKLINKKYIDEYNSTLPLGFHAYSREEKYIWNALNEDNYFILFVTLLIIFIVSAIILNELLGSLVILFSIPISYIGIFCASIIFNLNFDLGSYLALILISIINAKFGILLIKRIKDYKNSGLRIINYYNSSSFICNDIFFCILCQIICLLPFFIVKSRYDLWYTFSVLMCGGLAFSILALIIFIPMVIFSLNELNASNVLNTKSIVEC